MVSKWVLKALVQKFISYFPNKERVNYWFQKNITKGVELNDYYFDAKITAARDHIKYFKQYASSPNELKVLELGTGWYPIVPIALFLTDYKEIHSLDLMNWTSVDKVKTTIKKFIEWQERGKLDAYLPEINKKKWTSLIGLLNREDQDIESICKSIHLHRLVCDARKTPFEAKTFHLACSNNTFEHIPAVILKDILIEMKRVATDGAVFSHFIDMSDHFAHMDKSINIYNFLKFSSSRWDLIDNSIQPQNRLRFIDYKKMYAKVGLPITDEDYRKGNENEVKQIPLAEEYKGYSLKELAISHGYLVSVL